MSIGARIRRFIENALPWYDPATERDRVQREKAQEERLLQATSRNEQVREAYAAMSKRLER